MCLQRPTRHSPGSERVSWVDGHSAHVPVNEPVVPFLRRNQPCAHLRILTGRDTSAYQGRGHHFPRCLRAPPGSAPRCRRDHRQPGGAARGNQSKEEGGRDGGQGPVISASVGFCPTAGNGRTGTQDPSVSSYGEPGGRYLRAGSSAWALLSSGLGTSLPGAVLCIVGLDWPLPLHCADTKSPQIVFFFHLFSIT